MRLQHVSIAIPPDGAERARAFYGGLLGLEERDVLPKLDPSRFIWYRAGGDLELHLMLLDEPPADKPHFCLVVDDLAGLRRRLEEAGVETRDPHASWSAGRASRAATRSGTWSSWRDVVVTDALVGIDVGTTRRQGRRDRRRTARCSRAPRSTTRSRRRSPAGPSRSPRTGGARPRPFARGCPTARSASPARCTGSSCSTTTARVLRPAILWNDGRTGEECAEIEARVGLDRLIELTGNRALAGFTAPKLLWLRRHEPETYARIRHVLLPKDYVRFRLTGEHAIDAADASGTLLFDVANRRWSEEVCAALEVPLEWLPAAHESTEVAGAGDQAAAALGVGIDRPGPVSVVLGTSGVVFAVLPAYAPDREARVHVFCHAVPGTWHAMGVMLSAAGSFAWLRDVLGAPRRRRSTPRPRAGRPARRACCSRRTSPASARRTPTRTRAARSPACRSATTAARSRGPCWRASPTACATRSSCCASSACGPRSAGSPAAARAATSGRGSSPRCSTCRSSAPRPTPARRSAPRCSPASAPASSPTRPRRSHAASASATRIEPEPAWVDAYAHGYDRFRALYPALRPLEEA